MVSVALVVYFSDAELQLGIQQLLLSLRPAAGRERDAQVWYCLYDYHMAVFLRRGALQRLPPSVVSWAPTRWRVGNFPNKTFL